MKADGGKSWQFALQKAGGTWAWRTGGYPEVSEELARSKAADLRKTISGIDPLEQKRAAKVAIETTRAEHSAPLLTTGCKPK